MPLGLSIGDEGSIKVVASGRYLVWQHIANVECLIDELLLLDYTPLFFFFASQIFLGF